MNQQTTGIMSSPITGICILIMLFTIIFGVSAPLKTVGFYEIPEGFRGTIKSFGKLKPGIYNPGLNWKFPFNKVELYDIRWQIDKLDNIVCGSSQGGTVYLDIEVVNRLKNTQECVYKMAMEHGVDYDSKLIKDYIPSEVGQFCKDYTVEDIYVRKFDKLDEVLAGALEKNIKAYNMDDCLEIKKDINGITDGVRINRPRLSTIMKDKFESIESEKKDKDLAQQQLETAKVKEQQTTQQAVMKQERVFLVAKKTAEIKKLEAESAATLQRIKDNSLAQQITSKATADAEARKLMAEADKLWLTPQRIEYEKAIAIAKNSKLIFNSPDKAFIGLGNNFNPSNIKQPIEDTNPDFVKQQCSAA